MARLPRLGLPDIPQHIIQRGMNRQVCFASEEDFAAYAYWLDECARKYEVAIHAWVFMTNHVHLLATPAIANGVSKMMQTLGRHYVRYFNHTYRRTGALWEGRFKSCVVDADNYLLVCQERAEGQVLICASKTQDLTPMPLSANELSVFTRASLILIAQVLGKCIVHLCIFVGSAE